MADDQGNIAFYPFSSFPNRKDIYAAARGIKEGWTGKYDWNGFVNPKKIPDLVNPKKGYIFTANGRVSSENVEVGVGITQASTARAKRIQYLLNDMIHEKKQKVDANDMKRILNDTYDVFAEIKTPLMIKIVEKDNSLEKYIKSDKARDQIKLWLEELKNWDYVFGQDMKQPTIFSLWEIYFFDSIFKKQITNDKMRNHPSLQYGFDDFVVKNLRELTKDPNHFSEYCYPDSDEVPDNCRKALVKGLEFVYDYLVPEGTTVTDEDIMYGNWHKIQYRYTPFTRTPLKILFDRSDSDSGSKHTINVGTIYYTHFKEKALESHHTANYRMIVDFGSDKDCQFSIDTGVSENIVGQYFYYNIHEKHMSLEMIPMNFNSLNTTHTKRYSTMRLIYKDWFDQQEAKLKKIEEDKAEAKEKHERVTKEDL
jgi:acyl-homoserine lactone acylase PvdQ